MKMKNETPKRRMLLVVGVFSTMLGFAQLPDDYVTKVNYHEKKEVIYSLPGEGDLHCLTLSEVAQYHGYIQFYTMDEYVDTEGELLTDQNFIEEQNVRDEWMEGYSRITVGKETIDVYTTETGLRTQIPVQQDPEAVYLNNEQAISYGFLDLNQEYYTELHDELQTLGLSVSETGGIISAHNESVSIVYDHNTKVASSTEYDSMGLKTKESVIQYALNNNGDTYFPETETIIEWFLGKNGCCIRKTTIISRYAYTREVTQGSSPERQESKEEVDILSKVDNSDYEVHTEQNSDVFRIQSRKYGNEEMEVTVYNMAGKQVLRTNVIGGEAVQLPPASRAGMYLVHIVSKNSHTPVVGKIIKSNSGNQF